jgi:hypothetical protein
LHASCPDYAVSKTGTKKDITTGFNIASAIQQVNDLSQSMQPTNISDEANMDYDL